VFPRFLVFLGCHVSLAVVDLGRVFEPDAVKHMSGYFGGTVREAEGEAIGEPELHLGVFGGEGFLEGQSLNAVVHSGHDRAG
jgi:hypothetical protein